MNKSLAVLTLVGVSVLTGCAKDKTTMVKDENVLAVSPTPAPQQTVALTPPSETISQPVIFDGPTTPVNVAPSAGPKTYVVKKGDTLFGIAKANYGAGKEWQKIIAANPGLEPSKLKAGQKINLP